MKKFVLSLGYLGVACMISAASLPAAAPSTDIEQLVEKLRKSIPALIEEAQIPGVSLSLLDDGKVVWTEGFGTKNLETGASVKEDTVFEAASLSKPVFAAAVLQLVFRGEFDLDQPLWEINPNPRLEHDERYKDITARQVLSHSTGLPNWGGTPLKMRFSPGVAWGYSGEGFVYLAQTLEKKTGLTLEELVQREVLQPLGMKKSSFIWREEYQEESAQGHDSMGEVEDFRKSTEGNAAASLKTTAGEYAHFIAALLSGSELHPETMRWMNKQVSQVRGWNDLLQVEANLFWGLGWGIQETPEGQRALWHWGDNGAFRCYVLFYPSSGDGLVYFTNSQNGLSIARTLTSQVFPSEHAALKWLNYDDYDDPRRKARIQTRKAYLKSDSDQAWQTLQEVKKAHPEVIDDRFLWNLGSFLLGQRKNPEALRVLQSATEDFPKSAQVRDHLGRALLEADQLEKARAEFEKAAQLDPELESPGRHLAWVDSLVEYQENPPELSGEQLQRLAGKYGPRKVEYRKGKLFYERQNVGTEYELYPLDGLTFGLHGLNSFRLRFEEDELGNVVKVVGLYLDGSRDETARNAP